MAAKTKVKQLEVKSYDFTSSYHVNDTIYHNLWNDTGKVVEVGVTKDSIKKMVVDFEKLGRKRLIMEVDPTNLQ